MRRQVLYAISVVLLSAETVPAGLIVTYTNPVIAPGHDGFMDVYVASESGTVDLLAVGFEFRISNTGPNRLEFVSAQPTEYLTDDKYIFVNDSSNQINNWGVGNVTTDVVPNDTFIGGDSTESETSVPVTGPRLLSRLKLTANTTLPPEEGETFAVSLVLSYSSFFSGADWNDVPYTSGSGTVQISSVPEPTTVLHLCTGGLLWTIYSWYGRRRRSRESQ